MAQHLLESFSRENTTKETLIIPEEKEIHPRSEEDEENEGLPSEFDHDGQLMCDV